MSARRRSGFTLIEVMAVVVVLGLMMAILLPNVGTGRARKLEQQAVAIAGIMELARERAVVTRTPHRVLIDLPESSYQLDWYVTEARAFGEEEAVANESPDVYGGAPAEISLLPPKGEERDYHPVPNRFGKLEYLDGDFYFQGVQTPEGWIERGSVQVVFQEDGTSDFAEVILSDAWDNSISINVQPLLDRVRVSFKHDS